MFQMIIIITAGIIDLEFKRSGSKAKGLISYPIYYSFLFNKLLNQLFSSMAKIVHGTYEGNVYIYSSFKRKSKIPEL